MLVDIIRKSKRLYIQNELKEATPKKTWSVINELSAGTPHVDKMPDKFKYSNGLVSEPETIAEGFNAFFSSVGEELKSKIKQTPNNPLDYIPNYVGHTLDEFTNTNEEEIIQIVNSMKLVGGGHDEINTKIFKLTFTAILKEIVHLMNLCLHHSTFPTELKKAVIKPIYKAGDKQLFNNYRPISLLPVISKLLEKIIYRQLNHHTVSNAIIAENQFGYRQGMSTYMPLLLLQENITNAFETDKIVAGIFLDLRKAFDTVSIDILLQKVKHYGIRDNAHNLIKSYLTERYQCVQFKNSKSNFLPIKMGVPQGSILGPLLFLIYVNDFPCIIKETATYLYADDTAIFINAKTEQDLQSKLNILLPNVTKWFVANQLSLNTDKTFYQIYSNKRVQVEVSVRLAEAVIKRAKTVRYLGVFIDEELKWKTHIAKLCTILSRNIGTISRVKYFLESKHLCLLYNSLILPHIIINYCCFLYSSTYSTSIDKIEKLQKRIARIIDKQPRLAATAPIFKK